MDMLLSQKFTIISHCPLHDYALAVNGDGACHDSI